MAVELRAIDHHKFAWISNTEVKVLTSHCTEYRTLRAGLLRV